MKLYRNKSNHTKCLVRKWMCSASFAKKYQDWINSNKKDYRKYDRWVLEKIIYITPLKSSYLSVEKFLCPISAYPNYRGTSCRGVTIFRNTATQNPIWNGDRYLSQDVLSRLPSITARWDSCNIPLTIWDIIFCRKWAWLFWSREKYSSILWNNETTNSFRQPGVGKWPNTNINCRLLLAAPLHPWYRRVPMLKMTFLRPKSLDKQCYQATYEITICNRYSELSYCYGISRPASDSSIDDRHHNLISRSTQTIALDDFSTISRHPQYHWSELLSIEAWRYRRWSVAVQWHCGLEVYEKDNWQSQSHGVHCHINWWRSKWEPCKFYFRHWSIQGTICSSNQSRTIHVSDPNSLYRWCIWGQKFPSETAPNL